MNGLFQLIVDLGPGDGSKMPPELGGAWVAVYASAPDVQTALDAVIKRIETDGFELRELKPTMHQYDPLNWQAHVDAAWPQHKDQLPTQEHIGSVVAQDATFYGPFLGYPKGERWGAPL